jgi:hypothetical protein
MRARWDGDTRGVGVMSGSWIARSVADLNEALEKPDWVAESPENHLLSYIQRACAAPGAVWRLTGAITRDGILDVDLVWLSTSTAIRELRAGIFVLVGAMAEGTTFVRQVIAEGGIQYHVTTGEVGGDSSFQDHGHLMRIYVAAPQMSQILSGRYR